MYEIRINANRESHYQRRNLKNGERKFKSIQDLEGQKTKEEVGFVVKLPPYGIELVDFQTKE